MTQSNTPTTDSRGPTEAPAAEPIVIGGDWMFIVPDIYREPKTVPHRTWNGRGVVGRLVR